MSNRRQVAKRCERNRPVYCESKKTPWATRKQALGAAAQTMKFAGDGTRIETYKCRLCGFYHLTSALQGTPRPVIAAQERSVGKSPLLAAPYAAQVTL